MPENNKARMVGKFTQEFVDRLKAEKGLPQLLHIANGDTGTEVLCRPLGEAELNRFNGWLEDKSQRPLAAMKLTRLLLVAHDPDFADVEAMFSAYPGLGESFGAELLRLGGMLPRSAVGKVL